MKSCEYDTTLQLLICLHTLILTIASLSPCYLRASAQRQCGSHQHCCEVSHDTKYAVLSAAGYG